MSVRRAAARGALVTASYDLLPQTVGNWAVSYEKDHMSQANEKDTAEGAEIRGLRAQPHELRQEHEFPKNAVALLAQEQR
ncbi:Uncharacterised protein [Actinomyces howellii]|uniref:Uncharacterized protein n=1 Tax=Actinomyces howellii TaxID=52771 RepID=A0A448HFE3_9ACTO|nr:Uncharacterised protein [Actinomyces howellii]